MSADEYWNASPLLARAYREKHKLEQRQRNEFAWLQGLYVCSAVGAVVSAAVGKKGGKKPEYPKRPVDLGLESEAEKEQRAQKEREKIADSLTAWAKAWRKAKGGGAKNGNSN